MTVSSIEVAKELVEEFIRQGLTVGSVWEYTHETTGLKLFTVFTVDQLCDIRETPYVKNPVRIWKNGLWLGDYEYVNHIED